MAAAALAPVPPFPMEAGGSLHKKVSVPGPARDAGCPSIAAGLEFVFVPVLLTYF